MSGMFRWNVAEWIEELARCFTSKFRYRYYINYDTSFTRAFFNIITFFHEIVMFYYVNINTITLLIIRKSHFLFFIIKIKYNFLLLKI